MRVKHRHLLDLRNWSREDIESVLHLAKEFEKKLNHEREKASCLRKAIIVNLFLEPSTRTRVSFELAGKMMGATVINWSNSSSSMVKGESLKDTVWTLEAMGVDAIVIRSRTIGTAAYLAKKLKRASVINAGDGAHAHPTQTLLDIYTLWKRLGSLAGKKVLILGDILHSRVARSNIIGFKKMGAKIIVSAPKTLLPLDLSPLGVQYEPDPLKAVKSADIIYVLRIQRERIKSSLIPSLREYNLRFGCARELLTEASSKTVNDGF